MEETSMKGEASSVELEIQKRNSDYEALEAKFRALEAEKLDIEEKLKALKKENDQLKDHISSIKDEKEGCGRDKGMEKIVDLTEDNLNKDKVVELMIENKVLECEKEKAESEVNVWKEKFKDLELWVSRLDESSTSKGGEWLLAGRTKVGLRVRNLKSYEDGLHVGAGSDYVKNKDKIVDLVHIGDIGDIGCKTIDNLQAAGSSNDTPYKHGDCIRGEEKGVCIKSEVDSTIRQGVRKQLVFEDERSPIKKMAPSTPAGSRPSSLSIIDIADSDDEPSNTHIQLPIENQGSVRTANSSDCAVVENVCDKKEMTSENSLKWAIHEQNDEEDIDACKRNVPLSFTPKRKRASNCVISESESDDDNIPICELKRMRLQEIGQNHVGSDLNNTLANATAPASVDDNAISTVKTPRRRLVALRNCREKGRVERTSETKHNGVPTNIDSEDDESTEVSSDSEGEGLHGFIVSSSDVSEDDGACSESEDVSDVSMNYSEILSNLGRRKDSISKWEFEADMLAAFGKDPELCMKAVCALYRQQTSEEKICKGSLYSNHRGFSKFDAHRGTTLGVFLTDGDPQGDVTKSVQELQKYDPKAIELCRKFATHYSKQLFEIYKNKEDPFFLP